MAHIADYTTKDLAADIHRICVNDPGDESIARAERAINAAIAAAVQAEREACAKIAEAQEDGHTNTYRNADDDYNALLGYNEACSNIAGAIRARGNGAGRK